MWMRGGGVDPCTYLLARVPAIRVLTTADIQISELYEG